MADARTGHSISRPRRTNDIAALATALSDQFGVSALRIAEAQLENCTRDDARATWADIIARLSAQQGRP